MRLTPLVDSDWVWIEPYMRDPDLLRLVAVQPPDLYKPIYVYVIRLDDGTPAGWIEIFNVDEDNRKAEVGISVIDNRASMGLFRLGRRMVEEVAWGEHDLNRLTARVLADNDRAVRCARAFGFTQEGIEREGCLRNGRPQDIVLFGLLRSEWEERCKRKHGRGTSLSEGHQNIDQCGTGTDARAEHGTGISEPAEPPADAGDAESTA